jgi:hypothetical protein
MAAKSNQASRPRERDPWAPGARGCERGADRPASSAGAATRTSAALGASMLLVLTSVASCTSLLGDDFEVVAGAAGFVAHGGGGAGAGGGGADGGGGSGTGGQGGTGTGGQGGVAPAPGTCQWSQRFGDGAEQRLWAVAVDGSGQIVLAGDFAGILDFGVVSLNAYGTRDVFVAKLAPDGTPIWAKQFGGPGATAQGIGVMVTAAGEPVVIGDFAGEIDFGGGPLVTPASNDTDMFLLKLTPNGAFDWARPFGSTYLQSGVAVAAGPQGQIVVGGNFVDRINLGNGPLTSPAAMAMFIGVLDEAGNELDAWAFGTVASQQLFSLAVAPSGAIFATGTFGYLLDFGLGTLTSAGGSDAFLVRIDPASGVTWSYPFGGAGDDGGARVALSASGDVLGFAGWVASGVDFGAGAVPFGGGVWDGVVATFDAATGAALWSKSTGGAGTEGASSVAFGPDGQIYATGAFVGTLDLGGGALESGSGVIDFFLSELAADGSHVVTQRFGGAANQYAFPPWPMVAATADGDVALAGWVFGSVDFGCGPLVGQAGGDVFAAKYH